MFGRTVTVDGKEFFVACCPDTPLSEVLERAAVLASREVALNEFGQRYKRLRHAGMNLR